MLLVEDIDLTSLIVQTLDIQPKILLWSITQITTGSTLPYNNPDLNDVTVFGTPGQEGAYTELHITQKIENDFLGNPYVMAETIERLFYNCLNSDGEDFMGNILLIMWEEPNRDNFSSGGSPILPPLTVAEKITNLENKIEELEEHISRLIEIE